MRRSFFEKFNSAVPLIGLLFAILAVPLNAQVAVLSHTQHPLRIAYDKAHEITLNGTIQEVVTHNTPGSPVGLHLLVAAPQGTVDAHLGPYLSKDVREALRSSVPVQIVGATESVHGKTYLLARQLIFSGRLVTVRSPNGFLVQEHPARGARANAETRSQVELNGGAR